MTKKTEKELKLRISELERQVKVFQQLVQDTYKLLLKHTNTDDKEQKDEYSPSVGDTVRCIRVPVDQNVFNHGDLGVVEVVDADISLVLRVGGRSVWFRNGDIEEYFPPVINNIQSVFDTND